MKLSFLVLCCVTSQLLLRNDGLISGQTTGSTNGDLKDCSAPFDIVVLLDSSVSLRDSDPYDRPLQTWNLMTSFASKFIQKLPVDRNIRVAVIRYSTQAEVIQTLTPRQGYTGSALSGLSFVGHNTNTAAALSSAKGLLSSSGRKIVLLMTDGLSTVDVNSTFARADELKASSVEIYSLAISDYIDSSGLTKIASTPDSKYMIRLRGQAQLDSIVDVILRRVCNLPDPTVPPPPPCTTVPNCDFCLTDDRRCDPGKCKPRYYREGWECRPCPEHCITCSSEVNCIDCDIGYFKNPATGKCELCSRGVFDLTFLIDSSGSIRDKNTKDKDGNVIVDNYLVILNFVQLIVDGLPVGKNETRVAVISFSNTARVHFYLDSFNYDRDTIRRAIGVTPYEGAFTNISGALRVMRTEVLQASKGDRANVLNVCVLVTDGQSTRDEPLTVPEAMKVKDQGTKVLAVGVTNEINRDELHQIVSEPVNQHFFYSDDIINLRENVLQQLRNTLCSTK